MGSDSDWPVVKGACTVLKDFGVPYEAHILSAHRTPEAAAAFARSARAEGYGVILCAAGMAAHLAGAFAAMPPSALMWWRSRPPPAAGRCIASRARLSVEKTLGENFVNAWNVGASIARPLTLPHDPFTVWLRQTGTGEQCSPLQNVPAQYIRYSAKKAYTYRGKRIRERV